MLLSSDLRTKRCPRRSNSRSSSSSTRLLSSGESGPPCGVPSTLGLTNPFSITPAFRNARMSQQPLVSDPFSDLSHQFVVMDSIEKFFQIKIHNPAVTRSDILLRLRHGLISRPTRPETITAVRKRLVPLPLQNLHHRLLDKSIQRGRDGQCELHWCTNRT